MLTFWFLMFNIPIIYKNNSGKWVAIRKFFNIRKRWTRSKRVTSMKICLKVIKVRAMLLAMKEFQLIRKMTKRTLQKIKKKMLVRKYKLNDYHRKTTWEHLKIQILTQESGRIDKEHYFYAQEELMQGLDIWWVTLLILCHIRRKKLKLKGE